MILFDSHAHLNDEAFNEDREVVIQKCFDNDVRYIAEIGYNKKVSEEAVELAQKYENIYAAIGMHPDEIVYEKDLSYIKELAKNNKVVAIGEIGLDYYHNKENKEDQKEIFIKQIEIANELKLPVTIHSREADMDMLEILKSHKINEGFIMHCFSSSAEIVKEILKLGGYISIAGPVTFKNARGLLDVVRLVPNDKILIETDSPYLAPEPHRGTRNDPSYVKNTAQKIAEIREVTLEEIANQTFENAKRIYRIIH